MKSRQLKFSPKGSLHLPLHVYLIYLLVCTFLLTGVSFSRYISSANGSDSACVAAGIVIVTHDSNTAIELNRPSDDGEMTQSFNFEVSNHDSEVAIRYDVVVKLDDAMPTGVTMTLDGEPCSENIGNTYVFSNMGEFEAQKTETRFHTLSFSGDYQKIQEQSEREIILSVQAEQID